MPKSSIIIGLGGTGQQVLTYLKKELLETHGGKIPENIQLLAFDTMPEAEVVKAMAKTENEDLTKLEQERAAIGSVSLEDDKEFWGLSGNALGLGMQAAKGQAPHIGSWFDANHYLQEFGSEAWDLCVGAGQVRQFGRLAFFMKAGEKIYGPLNKAFITAGEQVKGSSAEVIIIASFAGGTGVGHVCRYGVFMPLLKNFHKSRMHHSGNFRFSTRVY